MERCFEIYWDDLTEECQERLLDFFGKDQDNYDIFPVAEIWLQDED